tara:strand:+ start:728 stop:1018 length:291 start_codon:yes stop_codon:yes gene_type:complete
MASYKVVNGERIKFTAEEEKARDAEVKEWLDGQSKRDLNLLREDRNSKLAETDWMSLPDAPTMSDAWKKYRQDLRDITKTYKSPKDVKWPTKPDAE